MDQGETQTAADVFGVRLRKLRTSTKWSQQDVADLLAGHGVVVSQQTVAKIERGARPTSVDELLALARVFSMSIGELVAPVDDTFGLGPSPVVQQLGDAMRTAEEVGQQLAERKEAEAAILQRQAAIEERQQQIEAWIEQQRQAVADGRAAYVEQQREEIRLRDRESDPVAVQEKAVRRHTATGRAVSPRKNRKDADV